MSVVNDDRLTLSLSSHELFHEHEVDCVARRNKSLHLRVEEEPKLFLAAIASSHLSCRDCSQLLLLDLILCLHRRTQV